VRVPVYTTSSSRSRQHPPRGGSVPPRRGGSSRKSSGKSRKSPLWAKLLVTFGVLMLIASGGAMVAKKLIISKLNSVVQQQNLLGTAGNNKPVNINGPITMLLVGLDVRDDQHDDSVRADTIIILYIPASHDQAYLVSLPRDLRVDIPDYPKTGFKGWSTKINAAFQGGYRGEGTEIEKRARGVELLATTIKNFTGINFTGAAIIDFAGFEGVLKQLGGVTMCVDRRAMAIHLALDQNGKVITVWYDDKASKVRGIPPGGKNLYYEPGCQFMAPAVALEYSRLRKGSCCPYGDYDRQRHQQQLIKAIIKEATSKGMLTDFGKLNRVMSAAGKAFVLDTQGVPLENFLFTLNGISANDLLMIRTNAGHTKTIPGSSDEALTDESMQMLEALKNNTLPDFVVNHPDFVASDS
jgi:LCP family protein required for cell wall assembly